MLCTELLNKTTMFEKRSNSLDIFDGQEKQMQFLFFLLALSLAINEIRPLLFYFYLKTELQFVCQK